MTKFMHSNSFEGFWEGVEDACSLCFEIVKIIEERLGLLPYEEAISNSPQDFPVEQPEKTLQTNLLDNLYNKQFDGTSSSIVAVKYDNWKMILWLVVMVDQKKYYMVPIRQVSFFLNRDRATSELEAFIKRFE